MHDLTLMTTAVTHQIYAAATQWRCSPVGEPTAPDRTGCGTERDRGAVSLEQVLWFVAAGVSVAVIAAILWGQIKDKADDPIISPSAP